jgi:hypothetical protein
MASYDQGSSLDLRMPELRSAVIVMDALRRKEKKEAEDTSGSFCKVPGIVIAESRPYQASETMINIARTLDWRIETLDADRLNLNDLEVSTSPLRETLRHASLSDRTYAIVVRGVVPEMLNDPRLASMAIYASRHNLLVLTMKGKPPESPFEACTLPGDDEGFSW